MLLSIAVETDEHDVHAALASPVRRRMLEVIERGAPTAHEVAAAVGLHVTTVRFHLEQLERAGLVGREQETGGRRGRPSVHYRAVGARPGHAREQMIDALAQALADDPAGRAGALAAGRRWADGLAAAPGGPRAAITAEFARIGFDPQPAGDAIELRACPFGDAARRYPDVVCMVHLGLAQRLAERTGPGSVRVGLTPFVGPGLCLLTLSAERDD